MRILIIDDDSIVAASLKTILEAGGSITVLATGHSGTQAIELYRQYKPDVLLMDIRMEGMSGLEAGEQILAEDKNAKILYLTTFSDDEYIVKALRIGAKGYILKQDFQSIAPALESVCAGQSVFGSAVLKRLPDLLRQAPVQNMTETALTEKEKKLTALIAQGMSNREIAAALYLSEGTVRNYISTILDKLALRDRTQLAVYYYNHIAE